MSEKELTPSTSMSTLNGELDTLLERYLSLLDEYTALRKQLSSHVSSGFLSLAQANFQNTTHSRYGQDYYDERMQAIRRIHMEESIDHRAIKYAMLRPRTPADSKPKDEKAQEEKEQLPTPPSTPRAALEPEMSALSIEDKDEVSKKLPKEASDLEPVPHHPADEEEKPRHPLHEPDTPKPSDPLKWFGILIPPALRKAQGDFVHAINDVPRLISMAAEMRTVEREVGRLRKEMKRAEKAVSS